MGAPAWPIAARGAQRAGWGEGAPPLADLEPGLRWQPPAARPAGRDASGAGLGGGEGGCPLRPTAASRNLQETAGPGEGGEGVWLGAGGPGLAGSRGPPGGSAGKEERGEGRAAIPRAPRPPLRAGPRVAAGTAACLPVSPDSDLASPGRAGAAARAALMARFHAAELSRSLSGQGTCPSASRGLLSMESGASLRPQRAGSGRAQLGDEARRRRRSRAASLPPARSAARPPAGPAGGAPTPPSPCPDRAEAEPGAPTLVRCVHPASLTALLAGTASLLLEPQPPAVGGTVSASQDRVQRGAKLGKKALGQQCPKYPCAGQETGLGR